MSKKKKFADRGPEEIGAKYDSQLLAEKLERMGFEILEGSFNHLVIDSKYVPNSETSEIDFNPAYDSEHVNGTSYQAIIGNEEITSTNLASLGIKISQKKRGILDEDDQYIEENPRTITEREFHNYLEQSKTTLTNYDTSIPPNNIEAAEDFFDTHGVHEKSGFGLGRIEDSIYGTMNGWLITGELSEEPKILNKSFTGREDFGFEFRPKDSSFHRVMDSFNPETMQRVDEIHSELTRYDELVDGYQKQDEVSLNDFNTAISYENNAGMPVKKASTEPNLNP